MNCRYPILAGIVSLLLGPAPAFPHDLWLLPDAAAKPGSPAIIRVVSGTEFPKGDVAPDTAKFLSREAIAPDGTRSNLEPAGKEGNSGLMKFTPGKPGLYIVAVKTVPKIIEMEADSFNEYLISDGLIPMYKLRAKENSLNKPARERYSKSPKVLMKIGDGPGDATQPVGLPLEIVPAADPFALKIGETLKVRVLFRNEPLADATLGWTYPGKGELPVGTVRTDRRGEALIPIAQKGLTTIRLTHMTRPQAADYEWESFWTTLTFDLK